MRVQRVQQAPGEEVSFELLDEGGQPIEIVSHFVRYLRARDCSPNTVSAYVYDLLHFFRFLSRQHLSYNAFLPKHAVAFLEYLRSTPSRRPAQRTSLVLCTTTDGQSATLLSAPTINRIFTAVSSFYEYLIVAGHLEDRENPIQQEDDFALARVSERHRPFMGNASRQRPVRRSTRVKTNDPLPRPLADEDVEQLKQALSRLRDKAMFLLMLHGGLRPGEVLSLHLEDLEYGRRRVTIRRRTDHPKRARTKSRKERVVDLLDNETLPCVSAYVMQERPRDAESPFVFLVGGKGLRCHEPLGYHALEKLFARHCERLGIREPWKTPHALRHTHATKMWEGGMRELTLQKRLGHASPESTRRYTRVSDPVVVAEYRKALGEEETQ